MKRNDKKTRCYRCLSLLQKGDGIGIKYTVYEDMTDYFYFCPGCDRKRAEVDKTLHTLISKKGE